MSRDVSQCLAKSRHVSRMSRNVSQCLVSLFVRVCPLFDKYPRASVEFLGPADFREISEPHDSIPAISREKMIPAKNIVNPRFLLRLGIILPITYRTTISGYATPGVALYTTPKCIFYLHDLILT